MSSIKESAKRLREFCEENPNWFDDDLLFNEDPVELARYGVRGHMDESVYLGKIATEESEDFDYEF